MATQGILQALATTPTSPARKKLKNAETAFGQSQKSSDLSHADMCTLLLAHDRDINRLHAAAALAFKFSPDAPLAATLLLATKAWQDKHRPGQAHEFLFLWRCGWHGALSETPGLWQGSSQGFDGYSCA